MDKNDNSIFKGMKKSGFLVVLMSLVVMFTVGCKGDDPDPVWHATPYVFDIPVGFPTNLNIPSDNPMTVEGIALGRHLFYDGRLSGRTHPDSLMTCATCHRQSRAFDLGVDHPVYNDPDGRPWGLTGHKTPHTVLSLVNLVWNHQGYMWNGVVSKDNTMLGSPAHDVPPLPEYHWNNIESVVWLAIVDPHEIVGHPDRTVALLSTVTDPDYPAMFEQAFGTPEITYDRISKAIGQFIRTIVSSNSTAHKAWRGEANFTDAERMGWMLFMTEEGADCFHCHGGDGSPLMTTHLFYNNAKDTCFVGVCANPRDRYSVTKNDRDRGAFKAPTLINVEHTGPYMHDGRFRTLDEVIQFYNSGLKYSEYAHPLMHKLFPPYSNGMNLNPVQLQQLKAFLLSLTDNELLTDPKYSNPRPDNPFFIQW